MSDVPNSIAKIQIESMETNVPDGEAMLQAMGGAINYCLTNRACVGDIVSSALDEATFQAQRDTTWVLCDGRSVTGTAYQALTGTTNIPDLRGRYQRMKDHGAGHDTHGELAIGAVEADQAGPHLHSVSYPTMFINTTDGSGGSFDAIHRDHNVTINNTDGVNGTTDLNTGHPETNPRSTIVNMYIKIDD